MRLDPFTPFRSHAHWGTCLLLALALTACGGSSQDITQCGNGRIDAGEQCDDGNTIDTDACSSVCQNAHCGDGAIEQGVEACDGENIGLGVTCDSLGLSTGVSQFPACQSSCAAYDVTVCGAAKTPTPVRPTSTATVTPTDTPTASPTPTLPSGSCGDGVLEPGETCTSCPDDCQPAVCTPTGMTSAFAIAVSSGRQPTSVAVQLAYRSSVISIPGSGNDISVRRRVQFVPPPPNTFTVNDLDYAVDIASARGAGLPTAASSFATARFDICSEAAHAPTVADLSCVVTRCADATGVIDGCGCVVTGQP